MTRQHPLRGLGAASGLDAPTCNFAAASLRQPPAQERQRWRAPTVSWLAPRRARCRRVDPMDPMASQDVSRLRVACADNRLDRGVDVDAPGEKRRTPLWIAVEAGHAEAATLLLDRGRHGLEERAYCKMSTTQHTELPHTNRPPPEHLQHVKQVGKLLFY